MVLIANLHMSQLLIEILQMRSSPITLEEEGEDWVRPLAALCLHTRTRSQDLRDEFAATTYQLLQSQEDKASSR
jgi:hypothetical protein